MKRLVSRFRDGVFERSSLVCVGLRAAWGEGYTFTTFREDLLAGIVVGIIALPLSMALAIASGIEPQHGLYTAIVAGFVVALLGGSRVQVSGPTAAFVVILAPIASQYGPGGLLLAGLMAGITLAAMGVFRLGRLIEFIPYPVTTGFTAGIALVIATIQIKDFLGLDVQMPDHYIDRVGSLYEALPSAHWGDATIGALTLAILVIWPRLTKKVPGALVALAVGAFVAIALDQAVDGFSAETIKTRFGGIPQTPPALIRPWSLGGPEGAELVLSWELIRNLLPSAMAIAMLGAIESLLSAVVADGMTGQKHDPDGELLAQGVGNIVAPFFGGIAATGAIARTGASVRAGARSPVAAMVHAMFLLLAVVAMAPLLAFIPMASMAALLMRVAWNMSEARHFLRTLRIAPRSDVAVQLTCFGLTVIFDMVIAVTSGVVMAALLFMRRMAEVADVRLVSEQHHGAAPLPPGVVVYEIAGPMFFGAAHKAASTLRQLGSGVCVVVLDMRAVPVMDATGLVNLESAIDRLAKAGIHVILGGVQRQPLNLIARSHLRESRTNLTVRGNLDDAMARAAAMVAVNPCTA
jgi:sulfate permease, SulP family